MSIRNRIFKNIQDSNTKNEMAFEDQNIKLIDNNILHELKTEKKSLRLNDILEMNIQSQLAVNNSIDIQ